MFLTKKASISHLFWVKGSLTTWQVPKGLDLAKKEEGDHFTFNGTCSTINCPKGMIDIPYSKKGFFDVKSCLISRHLWGYFWRVTIKFFYCCLSTYSMECLLIKAVFFNLIVEKLWLQKCTDYSPIVNIIYGGNNLQIFATMVFSTISRHLPLFIYFEIIK